ncbi:MAG: hypothetical protein QOH09_2442, partial [Pseudonocardiales bacterium]|nr:hypothetical protein [Pseudonocardiales bacterium]
HVIFGQNHPQPAERHDVTITTRTRLPGFPVDRHNPHYRPHHPVSRCAAPKAC